MTAPLNDDLNELIATAVNARVEAAVLEALSGDATIGKMVVAALQQQVEVPKRDGYGKDRVPFINHLLSAAIREAAKNAVARVLVDEQQLIEDEVRKHLRKNAPELAAKMAGQLAEISSKGYGIAVTLRLPND